MPIKLQKSTIKNSKNSKAKEVIITTRIEIKEIRIMETEEATEINNIKTKIMKNKRRLKKRNFSKACLQRLEPKDQPSKTLRKGKLKKKM